VQEILQNPHAMVYQKFTCDNCGTRQTIETPNKLFTKGQCEECKHITDIQAKGCNYTIIFNSKGGVPSWLKSN
jgi:hypothetical protein